MMLSPTLADRSLADTMQTWLFIDENGMPLQSMQEQTTRHVRELEATIAQLLARQQQLEAQAYRDNLTGLANRNMLKDRFACATERAKRNGSCFALMMIDLDGFKAVNDTYGHAAGDAVLMSVSRRLKRNLRTCDTAARIGGDEFAIIIESVDSLDQVEAIEHKLVHAITGDINLGRGATTSVGASIGRALYPDDGLDLPQMLHVADAAMYECKTTSRMGLL